MLVIVQGFIILVLKDLLLPIVEFFINYKKSTQFYKLRIYLRKSAFPLRKAGILMHNFFDWHLLKRFIISQMNAIKQHFFKIYLFFLARIIRTDMFFSKHQTIIDRLIHLIIIFLFGLKVKIVLDVLFHDVVSIFCY